MATSEKRTLEIRAKLTDALTAPLGGMQGKIVTWAKRVAGSFKNVFDMVFNLKTAVLGLGTAFISLSTIRAFGEQADALLKLSTSTGDTVENLSELQATFELAGIASDSFKATLQALLVQARKAQDEGGDELRQSFAALGITLQDLQSLGPAQIFEKMAEGLEGYRTAQEKAVALGKVLPKQFLDLLPVLGKGLQAFQESVREARNSGATVTERQAEVSERLNDSLSKIGIAIGGVSRALIEQFGPQAIALFERVAKEITNNRDGIVSIAKAVGETLVRAFGLAADAVIGLIGVIEDIPGVDLIDEEVIRSQISRIKSDLRDLGESRTGASSNRKAQIEAILGDPDEIERVGLKGVRRLREELAQLDDEIINARNAKWIERIAARETEMLADLADLETRLNEGLAGSMRRARERFAKELDAVAKSASGATQPPVEAPPTREIVQSVFEPPKTPPLAPMLDEAADAAGRAADNVKKIGDNARKAGDETRYAFAGDFWGGFNDGAKDAVAALTNFTAAGQAAAYTIIEGGFNGISDAFADVILGTKSAKEAFRDFARAFLTDATRMITRLLLIRTLSSVFGSSGGTGIALEKGGIVEGNMSTPVRAFAKGGVTTGPTLALFGEGKNREAFVPLPDNRSIPVTLTGGGGGTHVYFNISAVDARSVQQMLMEQGKTIAAVVAEQAGGRSTKFRQDMAKATR